MKLDKLISSAMIAGIPRETVEMAKMQRQMAALAVNMPTQAAAVNNWFALDIEMGGQQTPACESIIADF